MWCRTMSQFTRPAVTAEVTPISSTATTATSAAAGPTEPSQPAPSGPPENFASTPITAAVSDPVSRPQSGAASRNGVGAIRTVIRPASTPAR